jgi:hypothetical protein
LNLAGWLLGIKGNHNVDLSGSLAAGNRRSLAGFFGLGIIRGDAQEEGELMTPYKMCAPSLSENSRSGVIQIPTVHTVELGFGGTAVRKRIFF